MKQGYRNIQIIPMEGEELPYRVSETNSADFATEAEALAYIIETLEKEKTLLETQPIAT